MRTSLVAFLLTFCLPLAAEAERHRTVAPRSESSRGDSTLTEFLRLSEAQSAPARRLTESELSECVHNALLSGEATLPKGTDLVAVSATVLPERPAYTRTTVDITAPVRRVGTGRATALVTFLHDDDVVGRVPVSLSVRMSQAAVTFDVPKGEVLTLAIERGRLEVSTSAVAASDGDVGDVIQVLLRPSGRALRARIVNRERAVLVEDRR